MVFEKEWLEAEKSTKIVGRRIEGKRRGSWFIYNSTIVRICKFLCLTFLITLSPCDMSAFKLEHSNVQIKASSWTDVIRWAYRSKRVHYLPKPERGICLKITTSRILSEYRESVTEESNEYHESRGPVAGAITGKSRIFGILGPPQTAQPAHIVRCV